MTGTQVKISTVLSNAMKISDEQLVNLSIASCISADSNTTNNERIQNIQTLKLIAGSGKCNEVQKKQALDGLAFLIKEFERSWLML